MSKKTKTPAVSEAEQQEIARREAIRDFNTQQMGKYWIDPDKVPTDEDIQLAKKAFEDAVTELQNRKDYVIADHANALRVAKFLKTFVEKTAWNGRMFVGVLNFRALMQDFIEGFKEDEPVNLVLDYPATQFVHVVLENYGGVGIESANWMAEIWDEYLPIYETVCDIVNEYSRQSKKCENLKEVWGAAEQGFCLVCLEEEYDPNEHILDVEAETVDE